MPRTRWRSNSRRRRRPAAGLVSDCPRSFGSPARGVEQGQQETSERGGQRPSSPLALRPRAAPATSRPTLSASPSGVRRGRVPHWPRAPRAGRPSRAGLLAVAAVAANAPVFVRARAGAPARSPFRRPAAAAALINPPSSSKPLDRLPLLGGHAQVRQARLHDVLAPPAHLHPRAFGRVARGECCSRRSAERAAAALLPLARARLRRKKTTLTHPSPFHPGIKKHPQNNHSSSSPPCSAAETSASCGRSLLPRT